MTVANPPSPCSSCQSSALHLLSVRPLVHDGNKKVIIACRRCHIALVTLQLLLITARGLRSKVCCVAKLHLASLDFSFGPAAGCLIHPVSQVGLGHRVHNTGT